MTTRYSAAGLVEHARALLAAAGLEPDKAVAVAEILVEGDLLGHDTHGLALLGPYLNELAGGAMTPTGAPEVLNRRPATQVWDGRRLPGPWLVLQAMEACATMARTHGTGTVVIRRSHHIAALAAYLKRATDQGFVMQLICSDRNSASVAPFGGRDPVFTPNPMAFGIPTGGAPILVDISCSITTNGMSGRLAKEGRRFPGKWLLDDKGEPTDDPRFGLPGGGGSIQLLGGVEAGHKGYGLTLLVETLTGGLAAHGRADPKEGWGATVFVQFLDPEAFGGLAGANRQLDHIVAACHASTPRVPGEPVRVPGERGLRRRAEQLATGVALHPSIAPLLAPWQEKFGIAAPAPLA
ncbi:MAG: Ldh family oxidoreductase [Burkholderiales bacterium]|nr:Ldh family oxidoreductase [Burkholderiales bacterium]